MYLKIFLIVIIIALIILNIVTTKSKNNEKENDIDNKMPYEKKLLLTKNEWAFYKKLKPICDKYNLHIIAKVRLADIVQIEKGLNKSDNQKYFNKIKNKHIDFILCKPDNLQIVALLELDDKSHETEKAKKSDEFKNELFKKVDYKLLRIKNNDDLENIVSNL